MNVEEKCIAIGDIQRVSEVCMDLLSYVEKLHGDIALKDAAEDTKDILASVRKLFIASMMYERRLICMSGLQGAGKTTLMKNFYGLDDTYLNPNTSRGELLPVLITEKDGATTVTAHAVKVSKNETGVFEASEVELTPEEFLPASKGNDPEIMFLELCVPPRHTNDEGTSFVLLPGYEKGREYWNNLIEFSVNSSDAAVFVFHESSLSDAKNEEYRQKITQKFGKNVIYAISGADQSTDENRSLKGTCRNIMGIPESEADRIVCTGAFQNAEKNKIWIESFEYALEKYAYAECEQYARSMKYIYEEIDRIKSKLNKILAALNDATEETDGDRNFRMLEEFDRAVRKQRAEFEKNISTQFAAAQNVSQKKLAALYDARPKGKLFKRKLFGKNAYEEYIEPIEMIGKALCDGDASVSLPDRALHAALQDSLHYLDCSSERSERTSLSRIIDTEEKGEALCLVEGENTLALQNDIRSLLSGGDTRNALACKEPRQLMRGLAELSTYYYEFSWDENISEEIGLDVYKPTDAAQPGGLSTAVFEGASSARRFAAGISGVMGVDLAVDGKLDLVPKFVDSLKTALPARAAKKAAEQKLASAATKSAIKRAGKEAAKATAAAAEATTAAVLAGTALAAFGAVLMAGEAVSVIRELNRMQRDDFLSAKMALDRVYANLQMDELKAYDAYMDRIRDRIDDNLVALSGEGKKTIALFNAKNAVDHALDMLDKMSDKYRSAYGMEAAF